MYCSFIVEIRAIICNIPPPTISNVEVGEKDPMPTRPLCVIMTLDVVSALIKKPVVSLVVPPVEPSKSK